VHRHLTEATGVFIDFYQHFDRLLLAETSPWHEGRTRDELFRRAAEKLPDRISTTWGEHNRITLTHIFFAGRLPRFLGFDRGPIPLPGGRATPHQGQIYVSAGRTTSFAPSLRLVADLAEEGLHTAMPGGPRDRRFSRWYNSGTADWRAGRLKAVRLFSVSSGRPSS
jgi:penicillin amidase